MIILLFIGSLLVVLLFIGYILTSITTANTTPKVETKEEPGDNDYEYSVSPNTATRRYFELTEKAGVLYRNKKYYESLNCCYQIIANIENIKKEFSDIKYCNKDFIFYTLMNLFQIGINDIGDKTFKGICSSDIITEGRLKEDIKSQIDSEINYNMNADIVKNVIQYFGNLNILSEIEISDYLQEINLTLKNKEKYLADKEKINKVIFDSLKNGKIRQKEIYKLLPGLDGRYILPFIKDLEKQKIIVREKEGKDYFIYLKK
ncbi:hypothetical protein V1L52_10085 [Treponema sp. HNW]|uniref:hypothetical protein n=1 Tax=Treponema sp. HNW TaxID=3116654 RepID=UPI003D0F2C56